MNAPDLFPFSVRPAYDRGGVAQGFSVLWHEHRPKDMTWHWVKVEIRSRTEITFIVHGLADPIYGGMGPEKARIDATVDPIHTHMAITTRLEHLAEDMMALAERQKHLDARKPFEDAILKQAGLA